MDAPLPPGLSYSRLPVRTDWWRLAAIAVGVFLVWRLSGVVLLLFFAILLADVLRGVADAVAARLRLPPQLALAAVAVALTAALLAVLYWVGPAIAGQADDLVGRLSLQMQTLRNHYGDTSIGRALEHQLGAAQGLESELTGYALTAATVTLTTLAETFAVIVMSLYLAAAPDLYVGGVVSLFPVAHRPLARDVMAEVGLNLRRWLLGQLADMATVAGLSAVGLYALGVPVPFALATLAGLLTIVPYFGAPVAGVPAVMVALMQGWGTAVWVIVLFTGCHVIEGYVVAPLVQHRLVRMPPAMTVAAMAVATALFGTVGIVLGSPLAVATLVIVQRVYIEAILGDRPVGVVELAPVDGAGGVAGAAGDRG
jgi:predicted PurR-regulated permease PerM